MRDRLRVACSAAGRSPDEVELLVVTKFFPAEDVVRLIDLGEREFGESREPEAGRKVAQVRAERSEPAVFDMIGRLQRNKAKTVAGWARCVHSLDSERLATALDTAAAAARDDGVRHDPLDVLIQVSLDGDTSRGGVAADDLDPLAQHVASADALRLRGLMCIAPLEGEPERWMHRAATVRAQFLRSHPDAEVLSAGMSGDLDVAVAYGSTCVRVGTAILGERPIVSP